MLNAKYIFTCKENIASSLIVPLPPPAKRRRLTIYTKRLFCQVDSNEILRKTKVSSYDTLRKALDVRKDEISDRLNEEFPNFEKQDVFWHSTCYSSYTSVRNTSYATGIHNQVYIVGLPIKNHAEFQGHRRKAL